MTMSDIPFGPQPRRQGPSVFRRLWNALLAEGRLPLGDGFERLFHWAIRIPLALLLLDYGMQKFPDAIVAPDGYGVPPLLFTLAAFAEVGAAVALVLGGFFETWRPESRRLRLLGDVATRAGGFAAACAVGGVIAFFYADSITLADAYAIKMGLALYLMVRGNR